MAKSAKGTVEAPGRKVGAKAGLNRAIFSQGRHQCNLALESGARYSGTTVIKVWAACTSPRCSVCGQVDPKFRESQTVFRCLHSSYVGHAGVNAARNVLAAGLAVTACEDNARPAGQAPSAKQEPAGNREELLLQPPTAATAA
jgi:putative transposase